MTKSKKYLYLIIVILFFNSCTLKEELKPAFPEFTTEGKNIVACRINEKEWMLKTGYYPGYEHLNNVSYLINEIYYSKNSLYMKFLHYTDWYSGGSGWLSGSSVTWIDEIFIKINNIPILKGFYVLNKDTWNSSSAEYGIGNDNIYLVDNFYTDSINTGQLEIIKLDTIDKIISGKFYFKAIKSYNPNSSSQLKVVNITDGIFDCKY